MRIELADVVRSPRLDGGCFFCGEPLGTFGANVLAPDRAGHVRLVGYACRQDVERLRAVPSPLPELFDGPPYVRHYRKDAP